MDGESGAEASSAFARRENARPREGDPGNREAQSAF